MVCLGIGAVLRQRARRRRSARRRLGAARIGAGEPVADVEQLAHRRQRVDRLDRAGGCARPGCRAWLMTRALLNTASPAACLEGRLVDQRAQVVLVGQAQRRRRACRPRPPPAPARGGRRSRRCAGRGGPRRRPCRRPRTRRATRPGGRRTGSVMACRDSCRDRVAIHVAILSQLMALDFQRVTDRPGRPGALRHAALQRAPRSRWSVRRFTPGQSPPGLRSAARPARAALDDQRLS